MSKADKMLKDLGYEIDSTHEIIGHLFYNKNDIRIDFDLTRRNFYKYSCLNNCRCSIPIEELKAINEKCKELGWLDVK